MQREGDFILSDYWYILILALFLVIYITYAYKTKGKEEAIAELRITIYKLMLTAERLYQDSTGQERFDLVIRALYKLLPDTIELFVTEEAFIEFVQKCYDDAKDYLDDGEINDSINKRIEK